MVDNLNNTLPSLKELCTQWIYAMYEQEKQSSARREKDSHIVWVYKKAYDGLVKHEGEINSTNDLKRVKGIGPAIIKHMDMKLKAYQEEKGVLLPSSSASSSSSASQPKEPSTSGAPTESSNTGGSKSSSMAPSTEAGTKKKRKVTTDYIPRYRSTAWSILIALRSTDEGAYLSKKDLITLAQPHADTPLDASGPNSNYQGWASMTTLLDKNLVVKYGHPPRYGLTEGGTELADRMMSFQSATLGVAGAGDPVTQPKPPPPKAGPMDKYIGTTAATTSAKQQNPPVSQPNCRTDTFTLAPGSFDVVLILDNREIKSRDEQDFFQKQLSQRGTRYHTRVLELGDVLWVARKKSGAIIESEEIVMDYIIERKRMDDLVTSIKDGRFAEQKFRLSKCGIKNVIYLIEASSKDEAESFGMDAVRTAITQTQVENGFFVKITSSAEESAQYLSSLTNQITKRTVDKYIKAHAVSRSNPCSIVRNQTVVDSVAIVDFNWANRKTKNFTLGDIWIRQLMTIPGISAEKAVTISKRFPTPQSLNKMLATCALEHSTEAVLVGLAQGRRGVGAMVAKRIVNVLCEKK